MLEVQKSTLDMAGASRLEQLRASMAGEQLAAAPERPAVTAGSAQAGEQTEAQGAKDASVARLDDIRASMANKDRATGDSASAS
jgi:hypothetical protein